MEKLKAVRDHAKNITTTEVNKFSAETFPINFEKEKLATNTDLPNVEQCPIANEKKKEKLQA